MLISTWKKTPLCFTFTFSHHTGVAHLTLNHCSPKQVNRQRGSTVPTLVHSIRKHNTAKFVFVYSLQWVIFFTVSLFTHTNTAVVFATSGRITTGSVDGEVSPQQIIFPALAEVHSHPRRRVYTLHELYRLQTIISHFSCGPVHWDKLRLSAQAFGERIHPIYLIRYLSTYILIIFQSCGALSLWKQKYNLWLCWGFVKSEKISPDDGRVILVQAWKIQASI